MILAIESSCDESALAVFDPSKGLVGEWINSQIILHGRHGGVVPDLAAREHLRQIGPLLELSKDVWGTGSIDLIAVTQGPGLAPCLALGVAAAKSLSLAWNVPLVGVNHLRGHVWSPFIPVHAEAPAAFDSRLNELLPHLGLVVSGGHTMLFTLDREKRITLVSSTRDDAAGEALDKGAKLLGLGYPGGPIVEKTAVSGKKDAYAFPRGIARKDDLDFSFSGLKTSLRYQVEKMSASDVESRRPDLCASYQEAVVGALLRKSGAALERGDYRSFGLSGGVANNASLRAALSAQAKRREIAFLAAEPKHTGDNAGMIAFAAWIDEAGLVHDRLGLRIEPSLGL